MWLGHLAKKVLEATLTDFHPNRQSRDKFGKMVVKKGGPGLKPVHHRHSIRQHERVLGQTGLDVCAEHPIQIVIGRSRLIRFANRRRRVTFRQLGCDIVRVELVFPGLAETKE